MPTSRKRSARTRHPRTTTPLLPFKAPHGGRRAGAGRKPKGARPLVGHRPRAVVAARHPVLVTVKLREHLPRLRRAPEHTVLRAAFVAAKARAGCQLAHYAILNDHLHLLLEADDRDALRSGLQGLLIRIARALNKLWGRRGKVFADRYHDRVLASPREVRNALVYVLANAQKHAAAGRQVLVPQAIDTFSSAPWFDGFRTPVTVRSAAAVEPPVVPPRTWLLRVGWRRHGLLGLGERPLAE